MRDPKAHAKVLRLRQVTVGNALDAAPPSATGRLASARCMTGCWNSTARSTGSVVGSMTLTQPRRAGGTSRSSLTPRRKHRELFRGRDRAVLGKGR